MANPGLAPVSLTVTPGTADLRVAPGESVTLSPDSPQYGGCYLQIRPHTIDQVRDLIGFSEEDPKASRSKSSGLLAVACAPAVSPDDLESTDEEVREHAYQLAHQASREYLRSADPQHLAPWKPVLNRFLQLNESVLNVAALAEIEVASGATLTISRNTHAVYARNVHIHGAGRIVCKGPVTFKVATRDGVNEVVVSGSVGQLFR